MDSGVLFKLFGEIALKGVDESKEQIKSTTSEAERSEGKITSAFKKIGAAVVTYFSVAQIKQFGEACINAYNVQVEAETKLETVMKQRFKATDESIQSIKDYASALQNVGVVGDEVQLAGAQQLATFLSTDEALKKLMPAMANLAVQQNGVNVTSESMVSIGNMMGKVMQGQTEALTRVGITFTEAQKQALEYGNEQERAAVLAQVITDNVGNMNEVMAKTDAGKIQQAKNAFGDLQEEIGARVIPIQALFYTGLNTVTSFISEYVLPAYDSMTENLSTFVGKVMESETAQAVFYALLNIVAVLRTSWDAVFPYLQVVFTTFGSLLEKVWNGVLSPVFGFIIGIIGDLYDLFCEYFPIMAEVVGNAFDLIAQFYYGVLQPVLDVLIAYIQNVLLPAWNVVWGAVSSVVGTCFGAISSLWNNILYPLFKGIITFISKVFAGDWEGAWDAVKQILSDVWDGIKQLTSDAWNGVYNFIKTPMENARDFIKGIIDTIKGFFNFQISWPKIPMPHFSITPAGWNIGDLLKGKIPSLGIKWYDIAMKEPKMMTKAQIFGQKDGKFLGGGESGDEILYGRASLMRDIREATKDNIVSEKMLEKFEELLEEMKDIKSRMNRPIVLDNGALVGYMLDDIDNGLGDITALRLRGVR